MLGILPTGKACGLWSAARRAAVLLACVAALAGATSGCAVRDRIAGPAAAAKPSGEVVVVRKGETVYAIAQRYRVQVRDVIAVNNLRVPYTLIAGQHLLVPIARNHVVRAGDTVYKIAQRYDVDQSELRRLNGLTPPYIIKIGQTLRLPAPQVVETEVAARPLPSGASGSREVVETDIGAPVGSRSVEPVSPRETAEAEEIKRSAIANPPPLSGRKFLWPVSGKILSTFGPKGNGLHNDGINIAAPQGTAVRATENGVVAYAGNELRGFGNMLLIKHDDGWVSAYAHNSALLVRRGDAVKRGQPIARVGSSGNVVTSQLHFELRRGKKAVDPVQHLGESTRVADLAGEEASAR